MCIQSLPWETREMEASLLQFLNNQDFKTINMSPGLVWQTVISQSEHADKIHPSFDCQFDLTIQNHFLLVNYCSIRGQARLTVHEWERKTWFQTGELGHIFVGRFVSRWAILSPGDMLNTAELIWDEFLYSESVLQIISTVKVSCFSCTFCCFQTSFC